MKILSGLFTLAILLSGCGYKGPLYLPKENDDAKFGVIQTGVHLDQEYEARKEKLNNMKKQQQNQSDATQSKHNSSQKNDSKGQ